MADGMKRVTIYTDGAARGNPDGPGGYGALLLYVDGKGMSHEKELSAGYRKTTNNRMELMGAIAALEALRVPCDITLYSDSQYLVKAFNEAWVTNWQNNGWRTTAKEEVKNRALWERLLAACKPHNISWNWVKGHAGSKGNERCDALAAAAANAPEETLFTDDGGDLRK